MTPSRPEAKHSVSAASRVYYSMTEQEMDHPTQGRRRRHKSPSSLPAAPLLPVPRLADHLDMNDGPSDEEGEEDAKRQRYEPTTPISTSSRPPNEYDEVMGITQVDPREAEGLKRGLNRNSKMLKKEHQRRIATMLT